MTDGAGHRFVLRRPPLHGVLATSNDMLREWRAVSALQSMTVPVAPALAFCADAEVTGAPFYLTGFVDGVVLHTRDDAIAHTSPERRALISQSMVDVLVDLHAVDPDAVGLAEHGRRGDYVKRQVERWYRQFDATKTASVPAVDETYRRLLDRLPESEETTVVHGDYRLGNCIVGRDGLVAAVVDWEISTLGDPLADVAYLLATWARPGSAIAELPGASRLATMADGFWSADALLDAYARASRRDVSAIGYYVAFNHWRWACIAQGVVHRRASGALGGTDPADLGELAAAVEQRAALAAAWLDS